MMPSDLSDEQLVAAILADNKSLYAEIMRRYQTKLSHYLRKFIRSSDELEDVLQEVFIKTYRNLYGFDIDKKFSPWIYRIAHNEAINHLKKYSKEILIITDDEWALAGERFLIKSSSEQLMNHHDVALGLTKLREKYRTPIILYFFEGKSYEEISDILQIPVSTVGVLIMRGKNLLKNILL